MLLRDASILRPIIAVLAIAMLAGCFGVRE